MKIGEEWKLRRLVNTLIEETDEFFGYYTGGMQRLKDKEKGGELSEEELELKEFFEKKNNMVSAITQLYMPYYEREKPISELSGRVKVLNKNIKFMRELNQEVQNRLYPRKRGKKK